jgi:RNA ligase (TIGR02306 family)
MSSFFVKVERLKIEPHHNADALEIARVGAYMSIVRRGDFVTGDLAAYIPEQAVVPQGLLQEMGLEGRLAGKDKDRVKAIKLRGVLSQGLCYRAKPEWREGDDVTAALGITKYEPPIPTAMSGAVYAAGLERCMRYDIENVKRFPEALEAGEEVVFTEKLHGTWAQLGLIPEADAHPEHGPLVVASKGFASKGLAFIPDAEENAQNLYLRVARRFEVEAKLRAAFPNSAAPVFVLGEIFGSGVQDLSYGASARQDDALGLRVFDIYIGTPGQGRYLDDAELEATCATLGLARVPVVYRGPFSAEVMEAHTKGKETVSGRALHLREGVVIRPVRERSHDGLGRVQLKSVSEDYLLRQGGTEFT